LAVTAQAPTTRPTRARTAPDAAWTVLQADCFEALASLPAASVDAVVCDPPYGIDFNGHHWDGRVIRQTARTHTGRRLSPGEAFQAWTEAWARECLRVLRPGGHFAAFGAPRTFHRLTCGTEDAGFELRDVLLWLYGTGMPKSRRLPGGRGTALKPAYEPILLARKPLHGTTQQNLSAHKTGALNIDPCRVARRWPANVLLSHHHDCRPGRCHRHCPTRMIDSAARATRPLAHAVGGPSRLFYCPKAGRRERDAGCEQLPRRELDLFPNAHGNGHRPAPAANAHPTVKPLAVMRWLVRLVTPAGGVVLDPFCGSGSTGCAAVLEKRRFLGIEREPGYVAVANARIAHWARKTEEDG
jgi:DNA modification methylase